MSFEAIRRGVLRRVRYAANLRALQTALVPPEGPFDTALTNGLLCIVAAEWPGKEWEGGVTPKAKSARALLRQIGDSGGLDCVKNDLLSEGLDLTQPFRHGTAHDEWAAIAGRHVDALAELDRHESVDVLERTAGLSLDDAIVALYRDLAEAELPFDPKERIDAPEPEECDYCCRETFLPEGWDIYGVTTMTRGRCVACGYERSQAEADRLADDAAFERAMNKPD